MPYDDIDLGQIGSRNGLLPIGTKPFPEPMLTYHQSDSVSFISGQFLNRYFSHHSQKLRANYLSKISNLPGVNELKTQSIRSTHSYSSTKYLDKNKHILFGKNYTIHIFLQQIFIRSYFLWLDP